jgi:hypothetical protein
MVQETDKKDKKDPPKYPCHMCDIPVMFALTALRYKIHPLLTLGFQVVQKRTFPGCSLKWSSLGHQEATTEGYFSGRKKTNNGFIASLFILIDVIKLPRRHLARKHSTNYKCAKEGCEKTFAKQYQVRQSGVQMS